MSPDGTRVYVASSSNGTLAVFDSFSGNSVASPTGFGTPESVAVNPSGTKVYVSNSAAGAVNVLDTATNTLTHTITLPGETSARGVAVSRVIRMPSRTSPMIVIPGKTCPKKSSTFWMPCITVTSWHRVKPIH